MTSVPHSGAKSVTPGGSVVGGHTKGPWSALGDRVVSEATWDTVAATGYVTNGARTLAVGAVETTAEERANARLIAAAPELLGALKNLLGVIDAAGLINLSNGVQLGQTVWFVKASDAVNYATEAIAKATAGETRNAEGAL